MITFSLGHLDVAIVPPRVVLAGRMDGSALLGELATRIPPGDVVLDTGGVTFINSVGMREWMRVLRTLRERGDRIVLEQVSVVLLPVMNMIPELATGLTIASFHAHYVCAACGAESSPLVDTKTHAALLREVKAPQLPCPDCGSAMDLADFPERYLGIFRA